MLYNPNQYQGKNFQGFWVMDFDIEQHVTHVAGLMHMGKPFRTDLWVLCKADYPNELYIQRLDNVAYDENADYSRISWKRLLDEGHTQERVNEDTFLIRDKDNTELFHIYRTKVRTGSDGEPTWPFWIPTQDDGCKRGPLEPWSPIFSRDVIVSRT
jgi:hypothetical protein